MPEETQTLEQSSDPDVLFASQQAGEGETDTQETKSTPETIKIGDKEYSQTDLATLIEKGERASEIERGAREKFDQAAEERKTLEQEKADLADMRLIWDAFTNGSPEQKQLLVKELANQTGLTLAQAEAQLESLDDPTPNEEALWKRYEALERRNAQLEAQLKNLDGSVKQALVPLEEIRQYVGSEKEAKQLQTDLGALKEATGQDFPPEKVKKWRDMGVKDVVQFVQEEILPIGKQAMQAGAEKARKGSEAPADTKADTLDINDPNVSPDDILAHIRRTGEIPVG